MRIKVTATWLEDERRKAREALLATAEGKRLVEAADEALGRGAARGSASAWQKAFAESQAVLRAQLAADVKKGLIVLPLSEAIESHESLVRAHWPRPTDDAARLFTLAFWRHGTFIHVPEGLQVEAQLSPWPAMDFAGEIFSLQLVVLEKGARASVLSGCVQPKAALGPLRMGSWCVEVGASARLEWLTLDHFAGGTDAAMRRFEVHGTGELDWRLVRLADSGARFPLEGEGPLSWGGVVVPAREAVGGLDWRASGPLRGEVLVFQSSATRYHVAAPAGGPQGWRPVSQRDELVGSLGAFPMEYAIEAEMALDQII